jgi:hypothetical protein
MYRPARSSRRWPIATCTTPPNLPSTGCCEGTACCITGPAPGPQNTAPGPSRPPVRTRSTRGTSRTCVAVSAGFTTTFTWSSISGAAAWSAGLSTTVNLANAAALVERICADNPKCDSLLWLHSDNGAAMKSAPLLAKLNPRHLALLQSPKRQQRQPVLGGPLPDPQVPPNLPLAPLRRHRRCHRLGRTLRRLVQHQAPPQRDQLRDPRRPTLRPSPQHSHRPQPRLRRRPAPPPGALVRKDPQLGTHPRRLPQP